MNIKVKKFVLKLWEFIKLYKLDFIIAAGLWLSPAVIAYMNVEWRDFYLWWLAAIFGPLIPFWVVVPITTIIVRFIRKKIIELIIWIKAQLNKIKMANEMLAYFSEEELEIIKNKGKEMRKIKQKELASFKKRLKTKRLNMIKNFKQNETKDK